MYLKIKQVAASRFSTGCKTEEQKQSYVEDIFWGEQIVLDAGRNEKNPIQLTISKLLLNCFWGKFAQRLQQPNIRHLNEQKELYKVLEDSISFGCRAMHF